MASQPVWIRDPLYLYEPSGLGKGDGRDARERQIAAITARPPRAQVPNGPPSALRGPERLTSALWGESGGILFLRHGQRPSLVGLDSAQKDAVRLTREGMAASLELGRALGSGVSVVSSPVVRAVETAEAIAAAVNSPRGAIPALSELATFRACDSETLAAAKARLAWHGLMSAWTDGSLPPGILIPCEDVARRAVAAVRRVACGPRAAAVTHDFIVMALLEALRGERVASVPCLAGVFVTQAEIDRFVRERSEP
jgi:broad specificity phosphatase PhoE